MNGFTFAAGTDVGMATIARDCVVVSFNAIGCDEHDSTCSGCGIRVATGPCIIAALCIECAEIAGDNWRLDKIGMLVWIDATSLPVVALSVPGSGGGRPITLACFGRDGYAKIDTLNAVQVASFLERAVAIVKRRQDMEPPRGGSSDAGA